MSDFITGKQPYNWMVLIYGVPGIGKSTFAATAPKPVFFDFEGGLKEIDCVRTPTLESYDMFIEWLRKAATNTDFETVVIDGLGSVEMLLTQKVLSEHGKQSLADFGYGKGWEMLLTEWKGVIDKFDYLMSKAKKNVLLIGHEQIYRFEDPATEAYDRYIINLHKKSSAYLVSKCDAVMFARYETFVKEREDGMSDKRRAIGTGRRTLYTQEAPAWLAKNRFGLDPVVDMTPEIWGAMGGHK